MVTNCLVFQHTRATGLAGRNLKQVGAAADRRPPRFEPLANELRLVLPLVAVRELERSEPSVPAEPGGHWVELLRVPERATVSAIQRHARVVAPAISGISL